MTESVSENNKRIAKNTLALYFRTFITMIVGLYTGRVMLQALGEYNYGINAVVGGIVGMSSLITATLSQAISRYITYSLGQGKKDRLKVVFSTSVNAQIILALLVAVALEIGGVWFLNTTANIPAGRMTAANWVLQCSIVTLMISLVSTPYNALIIAHERMTIYAYMSIVDVCLKLAICFMILSYGGDRLIFLALLQVGVSVFMWLFYSWYCHRHFEEARYSPKMFDKALVKELTVFSGWNLLNNGAYVFATQGVNMLVNVFFGVIFNTSRAIATTVNGAIQGFVGNFTMAYTPQITKQYAAGNIGYSVRLATTGTKITCLMMLVFLVPVFMEAETLLYLWLGQVPEYAPLFLRLTMFESLAVASGQNLYRLIQADGRIRLYNIQASIFMGLIFVTTWVAYKFGAPVWTAYVVFIVDFFLLNFIRFYDLKQLMKFSIREFFKECVIPCTIALVTSFVLPVIVVGFMAPGIVRFFVNGAIAFSWACFCCFIFGLNKEERTMLTEKAKTISARIFSRKREVNKA